MNNMLRPITLTTNSNFIADSEGTDVGQGWKDFCKRFEVDGDDDWKKCDSDSTNNLCNVGGDASNECVPNDTYGSGDEYERCQVLSWVTSETYMRTYEAPSTYTNCKIKSDYSCSDANSNSSLISESCNRTKCSLGIDEHGKFTKCVDSDDPCDRFVEWIPPSYSSASVACDRASKVLGRNCVVKELPIPDQDGNTYLKCTSSARSLFGSAAGLTLLAIYSVL